MTPSSAACGTEILNGTGNGYPYYNNVFVVGLGSTTASGGYGNDTYSYASGDGAMTISDSGGTNHLVVGVRTDVVATHRCRVRQRPVDYRWNKR